MELSPLSSFNSATRGDDSLGDSTWLCVPSNGRVIPFPLGERNGEVGRKEKRLRGEVFLDFVNGLVALGDVSVEFDRLSKFLSEVRNCERGIDLGDSSGDEVPDEVVV